MKINDILTEQGVIVKGVNTTVDAAIHGETERSMAAKLSMNKGGNPPVISK